MNAMNDRIIRRAKELGLTQTDITNLTKVSKGAISKWFNAAAKPSGDNLVKLAHALDTTPQWLSNGIIDSQVRESAAEYAIEPLMQKKVPLIENLKEPSNLIKLATKKDGKWMFCPFTHSKETFALKAFWQSMSPEFKKGMIIFIDPARMPKNEEFCLIQIKDSNQITLKQYVTEDGKAYLKSINPEWPNRYIELTENDQIIGRLIGTCKEY